jgi:hypothetical protein
MRADDVQATIDQAIEKAIAPIQSDLADLLLKIGTLENAGNPSQKAKPVPAQVTKSSASEAEVQKWVKRCEAEPALRAAIEEGLSQNLTGKALVDWVFSKGFGANENAKPFDSSVAARMRGAIEYLNNINNGDSNV